jgi:TRAP-type C4-dicarboxylate transport system substrate-binding protein
MKTKLLLIGIAVALAIVPMAGVSALAKTRTLKAVCEIPADNIAMSMAWKYADAVKRYSNGQLVINILGNGEVIPTEEQIFAVGKGVIDLDFIMGDDISQATGLGLGMSQTNMKPWEERKRGIWDFYRKVLAEETNTFWLGHYLSPQWWVITANKPWKSPKEMKGAKIRCGSTHFAAVKAIGAIPVSSPMSEIYSAMERGVVDGFVFPSGGWIEWGWQEVTKYLVGPRILTGQGSAPLLNLDVWKSLSEQEQQWLLQPMLDYEKDWFAFSYWIFAGDVYGEEAMVKAGLKRIKWSDEDNKSFDKIWRDASWKYATSEMKPDVAKRFSELIGR